MIRDRSISLRLTVWFSSVFFVGLALFGGTMWFILQDTLQSGRSRTLDRRADRLSDLLRELQAESPEQHAGKYQAFAGATGGGLMEVFRSNGTRALPSPSTDAQGFPWPQAKDLDRERFSEVTFSGQPYRVLARPFTLGTQPLVLFVAAPLENNRQVLRAFSSGLLWTIPAMLSLCAVGGYILSRRALKPVDQITATTRSISVSNLSKRLPVPNTRDELQRLSETCNEMLGRLESAVNEIKRFTADASHELRNPLSFVGNVAALALRNREVDATSRRALEEIVEECGKASRLLEDMLTLARADAGNANLAFEPVDLTEVVTEACERSRLLAAAKRHTLTVSLSEGCRAPVWGDHASLYRLLWILVENAAKYTPAPGRINVSLTVTAEDVTVAVQDNGIGISPADLPHVFNRFFRADPSRSQVEGSGLGLAIAKWIGDVHRARISVDSKEGAGTLFQVVFPLLTGSSHGPRTAGRLASAARQ